MPLDQYIEGGHGEGQTRLKIRPAPMHHFFQMADEREHREHRLHQHAILPFTALTHFKIARIAFRSMKAGVAQNNHALFNLANEPLKGLVCDIGGGTRPPHNQPPLVQQQTQFAADGIVKLLGMILSPGNRRHFPDAISTDPTLRQPAPYP